MPRFTVSVVMLAVAGLIGTGTPAQAVTATPSTRAFISPAVDAPATWEPESGCDQTEKKGPKRLRRLLNATYGAFGSNILRACTAAHSGHEEGRALDWMVNKRVPEQREVAESFLAWLTAPDELGNTGVMARRLGVSYVIWNNKMWRPYDATWSEYRNCAKPKLRGRAYDNACHRNHVHVSFSWDGALGRTSFFTGFVACPAAGYELWPPLLQLASAEFVPVTPIRVLGSRGGIGLPAGPCRVHPDARTDLPVLGAGGVVPPSGVASVSLHVGVSRLDAPTEIRVWTAGTEAPLTPNATADKGVPAAFDVTVPVGPEGVVSLQLSGGMGHVTVDVTGYALATVPVQPPGYPVDPSLDPGAVLPSA